MAAYAAAVSLNRTLSTILNYWDVLLYPLVVKTFEFAVKGLTSFQNFVERLNSRTRKRMNDSLARITEAIREHEEAIEIFNFTKQATGPEYEEFSRLIHSLVEQLKKVKEEYYTLPQDEEEAVSSSGVVSKSKMVGLCDKRRQLKDDIMVPTLKNTIYSLVGMAGIGKTALAREIFEDFDISEWFDCLAWVYVGYEWTTKEIRKEILAQVDPEAHKMLIDGDEEEIREGLKESLKGKRYLIVFDDVWFENANQLSESSFPDYQLFESSFPDNQNGSQIILTTRFKMVGLYMGSYLFDMRLLDEEESWDLLRDKVFCPPHLHDFGKKIAKKCDGLPLTIVTVAGLLSGAEESLWIDVATKKRHQIFIGAYDQISKVLYPSYNLLKNDEKLYFLYMAAFPQKYEIPKSRLINLWLVEDLVEPGMDDTLEFFEFFMLEIFYMRSMIMVHQRSCLKHQYMHTAAIKTCGLHSVWWHFCRKEAKRINIFYVLDFYDKDELEEGIKDQSRLSIHNNVLFALKDVHSSIEKICACFALSLLCFGPYSPYMVPICFGLKSLVRLDALNIRFYDFPSEVLELVMLKYLALTCNGKLPPYVSRLQKLQYLIVHPHLSIKSRGALPYIPKEIWDLEELKHLEVMGCDLLDYGDTSLLKLLTLSDVTTGSCVILKRVPNLTKLGIRIELAPDAAEPLPSFDHISDLTNLESLKCIIVNPEYRLEAIFPVSSFPSLPSSLKKLSLSGLGYPWEEMSTISSLPNLEVLKLRCNAFLGPEWEVEENEFPKLDNLLIEDIDLIKLKWPRGSFKLLDVLRIKHCYKLEEVHVGDLKSISDLEVVDCNPLVEWHIKCSTSMHDGLAFCNLLVCSSWKS